MKITDEGSWGTIIRKIAIKDGPIHDYALSPTGRKFQVEMVIVKYRLMVSGSWTFEGFADVDISGPVLKKDGTPGQLWHNRHPEYSGYGANREILPEYQWVYDLAHAACPAGRPSLPALEA